MEIEILRSFGSYAEGQIIRTAGNNPYWNRRLKDAETDGCCRIAPKQPRQRKSPKPVETVHTSEDMTDDSGK